VSQCRTCHQEIVWGITKGGKRVPLDPPSKRYVMTADYGEDDLHVEMATTFLSHFATCPQADEHRKGPETRPLQQTETPVREEGIPGSTEDYLRGGNDG